MAGLDTGSKGTPRSTLAFDDVVDVVLEGKAAQAGGEYVKEAYPFPYT